MPSTLLALPLVVKSLTNCSVAGLFPAVGPALSRSATENSVLLIPILATKLAISSAEYCLGLKSGSFVLKLNLGRECKRAKNNSFAPRFFTLDISS